MSSTPTQIVSKTQLTFKAIKTFVNELNENFGASNHSLKLYHRLLEKTTDTHLQSIEKHIDAFRLFCLQNQEAILNKDLSKLNTEHQKVLYSTKVYIDIGSIFRSTDKETSEVIWKHLLTIYALIDPTAKAKEILKQSTSGKEGDLFSKIFSKVEEHVSNNQTTNPLEFATSLLGSGVLNDIISDMDSGVKDGSLNLGKIIGSVENLVKSLPNDGSATGNINPNNILNMFQSLGLNSNTTNDALPDLSNINLGSILSTILQPPSPQTTTSSPIPASPIPDFKNEKIVIEEVIKEEEKK